MSNQNKFMFLAATAAAFACASQAATYNGDLLIGFTTGVGNDVIYDLGAATSLTDGQTWNLGSQLSGFNLNNVSWGVIGDKNISTVRYAWTTTDPLGIAVQPVPSTGVWNAIDTALKSIYQNFATAGAGQSLSIAASDDNSWYNQTINGVSTSQYVNVYENPNVLGVTTDDYYSTVATNQPPQLVGHFSLAANGVVTFHTGSVVPPAPQLSITRNGNTATISFATVNGATYTLYYTNSPGLNAPIATWPSSPTTVMGNGQTNSIQDTTTDLNRVYRVGAH